jgi:transcriptional regulator with XRE-family HTH domain
MLLPDIERLKQVRLERGLTYYQLARVCGLADASVVYKLLRGITQPRETTLYKIRVYLAAPDKARREARVPARPGARPEVTDAA